MPTWTTRHQLLRFFQNLLTRGSSMDLYIFLSSHMYLLRLALIENENRLRQAVRQIGRALGDELKTATARAG